MQKLEDREASLRPQVSRFTPSRLDHLPPSASDALTKLLLVDFRSGEAVHQHPELRAYLTEGWQVRSAVPRIVESEGTKLLVVLMKPHKDMSSVPLPALLSNPPAQRTRHSRPTKVD